MRSSAPLLLVFVAALLLQASVAQFGLPLMNVALHVSSISTNARARLSPPSSLAIPFTSTILETLTLTNDISFADADDIIVLWLILENKGTHNAFFTQVNITLPPFASFTSANPASVTTSNGTVLTGFTGDLPSGLVFSFTPPLSDNGDNIWVVSFGVRVSDSAASGSFGGITATIPYYAVTPGGGNLVLSPPSSAVRLGLAETTLVSASVAATNQPTNIKERPRVPFQNDIVIGPDETADISLSFLVPEGKTENISARLSSFSFIRASSASCQGLLGEFFPTIGFTSTPVINISSTIDYTFNNVRPPGLPPSFPTSRFSGRYTGCLFNELSVDRNVRLFLTVDDFFSLHVGGNLVLQQWTCCANNLPVDVTLPANSCTPVVMEWVQSTGVGYTRMFWNPNGHNGTVGTIVPPSNWRYACGNTTAAVSLLSATLSRPTSVSVGSFTVDTNAGLVTLSDVRNLPDGASSNDDLNITMVVYAATNLIPSDSTRVSTAFISTVISSFSSQNFTVPVRVGEPAPTFDVAVIYRTSTNPIPSTLSILPGETVTTSLGVSQSLKCAQGLLNQVMGLVCESGVISDITLTSFGTLRPVCTRGVVNATLLAGGCNSDSAFNDTVRNTCIGLSSCSITVSTPLGAVCGGNRYLTVTYRCGFAATSAFDVSVSGVFDPRITTVSSIQAALASNYVSATGAFALAPVSALSPASPLVARVDFFAPQSSELGMTGSHTFSVGYRRFPAAPLDAISIVRRFTIPSPAWQNSGSPQPAMTARFSSAWISRFPHFWAMYQGEEVAATFQYQMSAGFSSSVNFTIDFPTPVSWINITSITITNGSLVLYQGAQFVFADKDNDGNLDRISWLPGNMTFNISGASNRAALWGLDIRIVFQARLPAPAVNSLSRADVYFGGSHWTFPLFQLGFRWLEFVPTPPPTPRLQAAMYCQSASRWLPGAFQEFFREGLSGWFSGAVNPNETRIRAIYKRVDSLASYNWGGGGPRPSMVDNFSARFRGCVLNSQNSTADVSVTVVADDASRYFVADSFNEDFPCCRTRSFRAALPGNFCSPIYTEFIEFGGGAATTISLDGIATGSSHPRFPMRTFLPPAAGEEAYCDVIVAPSGAYVPSFNVSWIMPLNLTGLTYISGSATVWANLIGFSNATGSATVEEIQRNGVPSLRFNASVVNVTTTGLFRFKANTASNLAAGTSWPATGTMTFSAAPLLEGETPTLSRAINTVSTQSAEPLVSLRFINSTRVTQTQGAYAGINLLDFAVGTIATFEATVQFYPGVHPNTNFVVQLPQDATARVAILSWSVVRIGSAITTGPTPFNVTLSNNPTTADQYFNRASISLGNVVVSTNAYGLPSNESSVIVRFSFSPIANSTAVPTVEAPRGSRFFFGAIVESPMFSSSEELSFSLVRSNLTFNNYAAVPGPAGFGGGLPIMYSLNVVHNTSNSFAPATLAAISSPHASSNFSTRFTGNSTAMNVSYDATSSRFTLNTDLPTAGVWRMNWTYTATATDLECGTTVLPHANVTWRSDPSPYGIGYMFSTQSLTIPVANPIIRGVRLVDTSTLQPLPVGSSFSFGTPITIQVDLELFAARASNLQVRVDLLATKLSVSSVAQVLPPPGATTSLPRWSAVSSNIQNAGNGTFFVGLGTVLYTPPSGGSLRANLTMFLRLSIIDPSCAGANANLTVSVAAQSLRSGGQTGFTNTSLIVAVPRTLVSSTDYVINNCQQWALLSPIISGDGSPVFVSVPQGWAVASNSTESLETILSVQATWREIVPEGGCIITQRSVPGQSLPVGVGYYPNGTSCTIQESQYVQLGAVSGCVRTLPLNRILIIGPRSSCDDQINQFCDPATLIRVSGIEPNTNDGLSTVWPSTVSVFGQPSNATTLVATQTMIPSNPVVDILLLFDLNKATDADKNFLSTGLQELCTALTEGRNFAPPNIGFATVTTDSTNGYFVSAVQPLTTSCAEVAASISRIAVGSVDSPSSQVLSAMSDIMNAQADYGWRQSAFKLIVTISDNPFVNLSSLALRAAQTNIVPAFYNPNPTRSIFDSYQAMSGNLPGGRLSVGLLRGTDLGNNRLVNWPTNVANLISRAVYQIHLVPAGDHSAATPFIASVREPQDLSGLPPSSLTSPIGSSFTVGWPEGVDPEIQNTYVPLVNIMGFGSVRVVIRSNTAPRASPQVLTATQDTEVGITLNVVDQESNRIRFSVRNITGNVELQGSRRIQLNAWDSPPSFTIRPAAGWFGVSTITFVANDGCKNSSVTTVSVNFARVNLPPVSTSINFTINEDELDPLRQRINFSNSVSDSFDPASSLRLVVLSLPARGSLWISGGPRITSAPQLMDLGVQVLRYIPNPLTDGPDSFLWAVRDIDGATSNPTFVYITVIPVNHIPQIELPVNPVLGRYDGPGTTVDFTVDVIDVDQGDELNATLLSIGTGPWSLQEHRVFVSSPCCSPTINGSGPTSGLLASPIAGGSSQELTFTWLLDDQPNIDPYDFNFTIAAVDQTGAMSLPLTIRLRVSGNLPPDVATTVNQYSLLEDGQSGLIDLIGRDPDYVDWEAGLSLIFTRLPASGQLFFQVGGEPIKVQTPYNITLSSSSDEATLTSTFQVIYVPPPLTFGSANFVYQFQDIRGGLSRTATMQLVIVHVNHPPVAQNIQVFAVGDRSVNITNFLASDPDSIDSIRLEILSLPEGDLRLSTGQLILTTPTVATSFSPSFDWRVLYRPPDYQCSETVPLTSFNFRACDNSGVADTSCSEAAIANIFVQCVNHAPYADAPNPRIINAMQLQPMEITLAANDRDAFDPIDTLNITITELDTRVDLSTGLPVGEFFRDADRTLRLRRDDVIPYPHKIWFVAYRYTYYQYPAPSTIVIDETQRRPRLGYFVEDVGGLRSETYRAEVSAVRVNQPPVYRGNINATTDQNVPLNVFFASQSAFDDDGLVLNQTVSFFLTRTATRGSFQVCDANDICLPVDPALVGPDGVIGEGSLFAITHPRGRCIFVPDTNTFGTNYASVTMLLLDSEGASTSVIVNINVRAVNQGAVLRPLNFAGGDQGVVSMFEDGTVMLRWRVTDVDSSPVDLTTSLIIRVARRQWQMFTCEPPVDDIASSVSPTDCTNGRLIGDRRNSTVIVPPFLTNSTTCSRPFGYPVPESAMGGCFREFRILYKPAPRTYGFIYTQFVMVPGDSSGASVQTLSVVISVNPVNNPPELIVPAFVTAPVGSKSVLLALGGTPISVYDFDALPASIEQVTIEAIQGTGELTFNTTRFPDRCFKDQNATLPTWICRASISSLNNILPTAIWTTAGNGSNADSLLVTLNDLGNVGVDNLPQLSVTGNITVSFSTVAEIREASSNTSLFIAIAVAAVVALLAASLAVWRFRKALAAPSDEYFSLGAGSISTAPSNPLYKASTTEGVNKLYRPK